MDSFIKRFILQITGILFIVFLIHIGTLDGLKLPMFENKIILAYIVNLLLAIGIVVFLYSIREKQKNNLGFIFMAGSFLKFLLFFLLFYPSFKADGDMSRLEFASFFVPYLICLVFETVSLSKMLKKLY